jgi:hypothetical protein
LKALQLWTIVHDSREEKKVEETPYFLGNQENFECAMRKGVETDLTRYKEHSKRRSTVVDHYHNSTGHNETFDESAIRGANTDSKRDQRGLGSIGDKDDKLTRGYNTGAEEKCSRRSNGDKNDLWGNGSIEE